MFEVQLYTDGSCLGNPGAGGYAAVLRFGKHEKVLTGGVPHSTNNRMELQAVIAGLDALNQPCQVNVVTDSRYVAAILGSGKAKANLDLVQQARLLAAKHSIRVEVIAGHSGHALNERCDRLAQAAARSHRRVAV